MKYLIFAALLVSGVLCAGIPGSIDKFPSEEKALKDLEDRLVAGLAEYMVTGSLNSDVKSIFKVVRAPGAFRGLEYEPEPSVCLLCKVAARLVILYRKNGVPVEDIKSALKKLCLQAEIETENVCNGAIDLNAVALKDLEDRLVAGLAEYMVTGSLNSDVKSIFKVVRAPGAFRGLEYEPEPSVCLLCKVAARLVILYRKNGVPIEDIKSALKKLCLQAEIETENVCNGAIDLNAPIFVYIIDNKPNITVDTICSTIAQPSNCPVPPEDGNWSVSVPPPSRVQPQHVSEQQKTNRIIRQRDESSDRPLRILQITDIHYDELYAPGSNAECGEPLCCGTNQGTPATPKAAAGNWGDYRSCDMPWYTVLDLMDQVKKHEIDYVYYTGDIINHRVWASSIADNTKNIKKMYAEFRKQFDKTPVYSILGNHEPNPLNEFAQRNVTEPDLTTQWLYDLVADEWKQWLPAAENQETIKKGGFYTVLVRPGFRIVALNSNVAYTFNWWLLYDHSILQDQLQWLSDTLTEAEKNGEIVHILSHVPSGDNTCLVKWAQEYKTIIERFAHIIAAQFVGHSHFDEMYLFFKDSDVNKPINAVFNGGSFTTFVNVNPNYVVYEVNPKTLKVENYDLWIYNLTEANLNSLEVRPRWYKLYSFKEAYEVESMEFSELGKLVQRMSKNQTLLDQYYRFKMRDGDLAMLQGCDQKCHENNLCNLVTTQYGDDKICNELLENYRATL